MTVFSGSAYSGKWLCFFLFIICCIGNRGSCSSFCTVGIFGLSSVCKNKYSCSVCGYGYISAAVFYIKDTASVEYIIKLCSAICSEAYLEIGGGKIKRDIDNFSLKFTLEYELFVSDNGIFKASVLESLIFSSYSSKTADVSEKLIILYITDIHAGAKRIVKFCFAFLSLDSPFTAVVD